MILLYVFFSSLIELAVWNQLLQFVSAQSRPLCYETGMAVGSGNVQGPLSAHGEGLRAVQGVVFTHVAMYNCGWLLTGYCVVRGSVCALCTALQIPFAPT